MDAGRLDELLDRYRDGALDAAGRAELAAALLADPALGASAAERLCLDVQLREALRVRPPRDAEATFEAVEAALSEDRRLRVMRRVEDHIAWRPRRRARLLAVPLAAAALLIAGLLYYYYTRGSEPGEPADPRAPVVQGIQGDAARVQTKAPRRLTEITLSHSSSVMRSTRLSRVMPALFTRMSSPPNFAMMSFMTVATASVFVTSAE
jgi:hypothetical protein